MVKVANNPQGARILVNELVAGLCLDWLGVRHPRPAVVDLPEEVIKDSPGAHFDGGTPLVAGLAFGSEYWQSDAQGTIQVSELINEDDIAGTMTLDTWIRNHDGRQYRTRPASDQPGKYEAIPVDQGHCIGSPSWTAQSVAADRTVTIATPIKPVGVPVVEPFVQRLRGFDQAVAAAIVRQVPDAWVTDDERSAVCAYLSGRATLAADALANQYGIGGSSD